MPIKWDNPPFPQNSSLIFPVNLKDENAIEYELKELIKNSLTTLTYMKTKQMFLWIEAEKYCGAGYALYKILSEDIFASSNKVCYCSCHEIPNLGFYSFFESINLGSDLQEPFLYGNVPKIAVIDHAELINEPRKVLDFSKHLTLNGGEKVLCIFIAKRRKYDDFWKAVCESADIDASGEPFRKSKSTYTISALSTQQVIGVINKSNIPSEKKIQIISRSHSFDAYLCRHYFLDRLISYLSLKEIDIPDTFKDFSLLLALHRTQLEKTFESANNLNDFVYGYLKNTSMENGDNWEDSHGWFVWSYGAARFCSNCKNINRIISDTIIKFNDIDPLVRIFEEVFILCEQFHKNRYELLKELSLHSIKGADIAAKVLKQFFQSIPENERNSVFINLCKQYVTTANTCIKYKYCEKGEERHTCVGEIKTRFSLGLSIGVLLLKMPSKIVEKGLNCFFEKVEDDYVIPKVNANGISLSVITNFEYKKFVDDNGYTSVREFGFPNADQLKASYYTLYKDLIGIIQEAASTDNDKIRRIISTTLKGSDWRHYNRIAHILAEMREDETTHKIEALCDVLDEYYEEELTAPVKWQHQYDPYSLFCNPLQPVVGISLFEARAYTAWLSKKTGINVHLVKYNPDYLSVVGTKDSVDINLSNMRNSFEAYKSNDLLSLINTRENSNCYYGPSNREHQEPATIGLIQHPVINSELFDFCGNVFEMQDTEFQPSDQKSEVHQASNIQPWQRVYNCSGGGWQHTRIRLPTDYMGQFTACTRNQDIGFRVVFGEHERIVIDTEKKSKDTVNQSLTYDTPIQELYIKKENPFIDLNKITLRSSKNQNEILYGNQMEVYENEGEFHGVRLFSTVASPSQSTERLMLLSVGYDIYAYHLIPIAFVGNAEESEELIKIIMRKPQLTLNLLSRKRLSNKACAYAVDCVQVVSDNQTELFVPYSADISCGKIIVEKRGKRVGNQSVSNHIGKLSSTYTINVDDNLYKFQLFEKIKWSLSGEIFLPDWIDIFDFVNLSAAISSVKTTLDCNTTMIVLSTIDTVDLHSLIRAENIDNEMILVNRREYETMKREFKRLRELEIFS